MRTELLGTLTATDGTATVTFDRYYTTDAADLWAAVTNPERLARWFAPVAGDLAPGGTFTIAFEDADVPECRVQTCDAPRGFSWTWPHDGATSLVEVGVSPDGDGSRLRIVHSRLSRDQAPEYGAGWQAYVRSLEAHLGGRDAEDGAWWAEFHAVRDAYRHGLPTSA